MALDPALREAYLNTTYLVDLPMTQLKLRIGQPSPLLDALLDRHGWPMRSLSCVIGRSTR